MISVDELARRANQLSNWQARRFINVWYRRHDESEKWPINNRFNATERAIRRVRRIEAINDAFSNLEYINAIEIELSEIINNERNW